MNHHVFTLQTVCEIAQFFYLALQLQIGKRYKMVLALITEYCFSDSNTPNMD